MRRYKSQYGINTLYARVEAHSITDVIRRLYSEQGCELADQDDPWTRAVLGEVNRYFESYSQALPEWEGLRQVFRAYVFAIWLAKHDPDMGHRLLAQLPPSRPPSNPLPDLWPDPQILIMRLGPDPENVEIEQATIAGGVGFEGTLLNTVPLTTGGGSLGIVSSFPSVTGFAPSPAEQDVPATIEGYRAWRDSLLKERGYLWNWVHARLTSAEVATFLGIALALALVSFWRDRKQKVSFGRFEAGAMTADCLATTLILMLVALHPDVYKSHAAPFTGWWVAVIVYTVVFFKANRIGRFGFTLMVMFIVLIWTAFTPGLGEIVRGLTPLHLAVPPLGLIGVASPLTAAGMLFPGTAWLGFFLTLLICGLLASYPISGLALTIVLSVPTQLLYHAP